MPKLIVALVCFSSIAAAQTAPPAADLQHAAQAFAQSDWKTARAAYESLANAYPGHALSRFRLGVAQLELGDLKNAETNLRRGEAMGIPPAQAAYRIAQLYAARGTVDSVIAELLRSADNGLTISPKSLDSDAHFAVARTHPRWSTVLDAFDAVVQPCKHDAHFREFDFWVGEWDVRPTGQPAAGPPARNTVTLEDNGCVVMEHWSAPSGSTGQSFNIFDRSYSEWRQTWVDNVGGQHDYRGHLVGKNMVFEGTTPAPRGKMGRVPTRLTFFNLGADSVRQYSEVSADSGKTWQPSYDLMYVRRRAGTDSSQAKRR